MRKLIGATILAVLITSASLLALHASNQVDEINVLSDNTIVRLHRTDGSFFCTGTVISERMIATAAHCVALETDFGVFLDRDMKIDVRGHDGIPVNVTAVITNIDVKMDTALLMGDFSHFGARPIESDGEVIDRTMLDPNAKLVTCGYSLGGPLRCAHIGGVGRYFSYYSATKGWMYYGCSGGPVIDLRTGKVLAVNHGMIDDKLLFNPLVNFLYEMLSRG